jgi:tellurite methyltransferase
MGPDEIIADLGKIDIYLLDQLIKGRIHSGSKVLDVGCGNGRNIEFMMRHGFDVSAVDPSAEAVDAVREMIPEDSERQQRIRREEADKLSFQDGEFDAIVCIAVLHFARDEAHFEAMLAELWRVLAEGGVVFFRVASTTGLEDRVQHIEGRHYLLPDGTERFLVDDEFLLEASRKLGAELLEPIKTVNVQGLRCMTTWVISKQKQKG